MALIFFSAGTILSLHVPVCFKLRLIHQKKNYPLIENIWNNSGASARLWRKTPVHDYLAKYYATGAGHVVMVL